MKITIIAAFLIIIWKPVFSQDSIKVESLLSIETRGQHNLATLNENYDCFNCITDKVLDNPIHHLANYTGIEHRLILDSKYSMETGIYLEERSHSGGNNTLSNIVIFPKILIKVEDFMFKKEAFRYLIKGGDLWNEDIGDMLRIYNIDYQGLIGKIYINNFGFGFMTIGDLSQNIGLDLHQLYKFSTEYKTAKFRNETSISINELFTTPRGKHPTATDFNIANYTKVNLSTNTSIEGQLDIRLNNQLAPSLAGGIRFKYNRRKFKLKSSIRYYSEDFNLGYDGTAPRYFGLNGSYIGPQLYPLKNFYRDFSQWALYTHAEQSHLLSFEVSSSWNRKIYNKISGQCDVDVNYLYDLKSNQGSIFPIYNLGIQVDFLTVFKGGIFMTNRHMELRNFYQTVAISKAPFLSFRFHLNIEKIRIATKYYPTE